MSDKDLILSGIVAYENAPMPVFDSLVKDGDMTTCGRGRFALLYSFIVARRISLQTNCKDRNPINMKDPIIT